MDRIIDSAKNFLEKRGLNDSRLFFMIILAVIAVSVFWNGSKIIQQNFDLSQQVAEIQRENEILELENRNKELQNEYLQTDEFAEITARRVFGRAAEGERVYIVPQDVALNALKTNPQEDEFVETTEKPQYQKNLEAWLNLYFGD